MSDEETAPEMLVRLGTDAMLWAQEFNKTAVRLGYSEMDEGWLIGWFANAIECDRARCNQFRDDNEKMRTLLQNFANATIIDLTHNGENFVKAIVVSEDEILCARAIVEGTTK